MVKIIEAIELLRKEEVPLAGEDSVDVLQHLLESAPVGLFILNRDFKVIYLNRYLSEIVDNGQAKKKSRSSLNELNDLCAKKVKEVCGPVFSKGTSVLNRELRCSLLSNTADPMVFLMSCVPLKEVTGQVMSAVGTITQLLAPSARIKALQAELEERDEFLSTLSHELKTPLTSLDLRIQLLRKSLQKLKIPPLEQLRQSVEKIVKSSHALLKWSDVLLDLTRIQNGGLDLDMQDVNLNEKVLESVLALSEVAELAGCTLNIHEESGNSIVGYWDPFRIGQIISNLLSNAIKYGQGKPIDIYMTSGAEQGFVKLSIQDRGVGIPAELQTTIFERFKRASRDRKIKGLGLGLYIVRQMVEAHGGSIRVESELGKGSVFICDLPLVSSKVGSAKFN